MISYSAYMMGRDEEFPPTAEMIANARDLLDRVEAFFKDLGILVGDEHLSSGYRPGKHNLAANGASKSPHLNCTGLDLKDPYRKLKTVIFSAPHLLEKHGLYMEDPRYTPTWVHLDTKQRKRRIFIPY